MNFKDKITNYAAIVAVLGAAFKAYMEANAGQEIDYVQLVGLLLIALIAYLTGKTAEGKAKTKEQVAKQK